MTLRLMEDVTIPRPTPSYNSRDWRPPHAQLREQPSAYQYSSNPLRDLRQSSVETVTRPTMTNTGFVTSLDPIFEQMSQEQATTQVVPAQAEPPAPVEATLAPASVPRTSSSSLTLIALRNETIWAVTEYWLAGDRLDYVLPSGAHESCALNDVDLMRTTQLNSERGKSVTFRDAPARQIVQ